MVASANYNTALLNLRVNAMATGPLMLAPDVTSAEAADVPRRSQSVLLGAASALAVAVFLPVAAPAGMATIPIWRRLLTRRAPETATGSGSALSQ